MHCSLYFVFFYRTFRPIMSVLLISNLEGRLLRIPEFAVVFDDYLMQDRGVSKNVSFGSNLVSHLDRRLIRVKTNHVY